MNIVMAGAVLIVLVLGVVLLMRSRKLSGVAREKRKQVGFCAGGLSMISAATILDFFAGASRFSLSCDYAIIAFGIWEIWKALEGFEV